MIFIVCSCKISPHCRLAEVLLHVLLMMHEGVNAEQALLRMRLTDFKEPGSLHEVRVCIGCLLEPCTLAGSLMHMLPALMHRWKPLGRSRGGTQKVVAPGWPWLGQHGSALYA